VGVIGSPPQRCLPVASPQTIDLTSAPPAPDEGATTLAGLADLVEAARFPLRGGGYDPAAVDAFLDAVAERVRRLAEPSVDHASLAGLDADRLRADAGRDAVLIRLEARAEADAITLEAHQKASEIMASSADALAQHAVAMAPIVEDHAEDRIVAIALDAIGAIAELIGDRRGDRESRRVERFVGGLVEASPAVAPAAEPMPLMSLNGSSEGPVDTSDVDGAES
jgi:DivIVA domain-containing protein